ncbi:MAG: ribosome biogenesis GTPase Der [Deltaproteobacteria bacterium]|nr:ribosome biogenesis GTPase Der [Deltaproteobacteria bacterium]
MISSLVAIVGRPNVGKSTLFNRLCRSRKAIVDRAPGVTRDRNYSPARWNDHEFTIVDTGGFEPVSEDALSVQMREQTLLAVEEADVILFLVDANAGLTHDDRDIYLRLSRSEKPLIVCANKVDGPEHERLADDFFGLGAESIFPISSSHGYGVSSLMDHLVTLLPERTQTIEQETAAISVAVVGRPNVGKSSLINSILGEPRLLVTDIPGTTRDAIDTIVEKDGHRFLFKDTAGIRRKSRVGLRLEKYSVMKSLKSMEECHIALLLIDATEGVSEQDVRISGYAYERGMAVILLLNKWDLLESEAKDLNRHKQELERKLKYLSYAPILPISALTGKGLHRLFDIILDLYREYTTRVATPELNDLIQSAVSKHSPPRFRNRPVKFYYATQTGIRPPSFLIFANAPEGVHFSYERFLANQIKARFHLEMTPVRLVFRARSEPSRRRRRKRT